MERVSKGPSSPLSASPCACCACCSLQLSPTKAAFVCGVKPKTCFTGSPSPCWLRYRSAERGWFAPRTRTNTKWTCAGSMGREPAPARASYSHRTRPRHFLFQCNQPPPPAVGLQRHLSLGLQQSGMGVPSASVVVSLAGRPETCACVFSAEYPTCLTCKHVHSNTPNASSKA